MSITEETTALILAGDGYQLTIAPEAETRKLELIEAAALVTTVCDNEDSASAQFVSRKLAGMRIEVEKCRKLVKEPVNRIGKLIDKTAADFIASIEVEEKRIGKLVGDHASEVARLKAEKEREERRAFEEARAAREAAERAAEAAANTGKLSDIIAARQADKERADALAARMDASAEVAEAKVADGVRFAIDFEVVDVRAFLTASPHLCEITVRRADTLAWLKEWLAEDNARDRMAASPEGLHASGIRIFKKPVVSSR